MDTIKDIWKKDKLYFVIAFSIFLFMILSILFDVGFFNVISGYFFDPVIQEYLVEKSQLTGEPIPSNIIAYIFSLDWSFGFDYTIIFGTVWFQILIPFFAIIPAYQFNTRHESIYHLQLYREKDATKFLLNRIFHFSFKISGALFLGFLLFYVWTIAVSNRPGVAASRSLFADWFGQNFYQNFVYVYHLLEGALRFFFIPFCYSVFAQSLSLLSLNKKVVLLSPTLYYYGMATIGLALYYFLGDIGLYLNPSVIMASGDYYNLNTLLILLTNAIPLFIGLLIIQRCGKYVEV